MYDGCPPPPRWIFIACLTTNATTLAGSTGMPPFPRVSMHPSAFRSYTSFGYISNKSQKDFDDSMSEPPGFFYTRLQCLLTYWFNWLNIYEIGVILVVYEDVFIADLQCAMMRP
jgi:hypothetical protein